MVGSRRPIDVQFLADDLQEIRALLPAEMPEEEGLIRLLCTGMALYRSDESAWRHWESRQGAEAEAARTELKRRETTALLVSMRSRTILSEMEMAALREQVRELERRHADQRAEADLLQRSIARLRRRIVQVEAQLTGLWGKRHG